jgi:exonuclease SbcC
MAATLALKLSVGEACPVCGSQHHPMLALDSSSGAINGFGKELDLVTKELGEAEKAVHRLQMEDSYQSQELLHWEDEHHSLQEQWAGRNIIKSEEEYRCLQKELDDLKNAIASWEAETSTNEAELSSTQELWAKLKNVEISQATALEKDRQSLDSLKQAGDALQVQREKAAEKYEHFKTVLGLDNIEYKLQEIRVNDREMEALEGKILKTVAKIKRLEEQKISIQEEVQGLQIKLVQFEYSLKDKKQDIGQKNDEMKLLCQDQEPIAGLAALQIEMTKLEKDYEMLSVSYEQEKEQYNELTQQCSGLSASKQALETQLQEQEVELDEQMSAREFVNWKEVLECFMTEDEQESQRLAIQRYREQLSLNAANLERVYVLLQGEYIEEEAWIFLQQRRSQLNQDLEECSKQLLLQEERKIVMEKRMEELTLLQGQKLEVDGQYELLEELENLFKGKKFIDFIARSRLSYMAREASKTLHDISRGRYALELNSDGEFIMRDDYNGGARRPTHTLSGGETFLTSLSLALALSSHIQLGKASLEFFFLDEGFGTLDAEVLEIVIAALEKLHSEKLSVGIISHVEELKHRIPRKLIVSPAQPGISGTTLSIEES